MTASSITRLHARVSRGAAARWLLGKPFSSSTNEYDNTQSQQSTQVPPDVTSKNFRLDVIKSAGLSQLHNQTQDLISRTRESLLLNDNNNEDTAHTSIPQKQEAARLESTIVEALNLYSSKHDTFSIRGDCIDILGVEVSTDLKVARVYWCLPYSLDIREIPHKNLEQVVKRMQDRLDDKGSKIQALVHTRLRAYYPPKLQWVAAEHVSRDLKRGVSLEMGRKKWKQ
jgi:ribosome-binding factor A